MSTMKYSWTTSTDKTPRKWFYALEEAYADMQRNALELVRQECERVAIAEAKLAFEDERIVVRTDCNEHTLELVSKVAEIHHLGEMWEVIEETDKDKFDKDGEDWWFVTIIPDGDAYASLWMDNNRGCVALLRPNGQILFRYF